MAASSTVRASAPIVWNGVAAWKASGRLTSGTAPAEDFTPTTPDMAAGMRTEPPPSDPWARAARAAATDTAAPPDEPPELYAGLWGLIVGPNSRLSVIPLWPISDVLVFPRMIEPASRNRVTCTGSESDTWCSRGFSPIVNLTPAMGSTSLTDTGMPSRGPRTEPSAAASAASGSTVT